jgi:hypothetical protein
MQEKKFYIAGVQHHDLHKVLADLEEGDELILTPEPDNKYDPNAVKIECELSPDADLVMVGYVPKKFSAEVSAALEMGELQCLISKLNKTAKPWEQCEVVVKDVIDEEIDYGYEDDDE